MRTLKRIIPAVLAALAACGGPADGGRPANWLTAPTPDTHAAMFPLLGTPHDPTVAGGTVSCSSCHTGATFTEFTCTGCHTPAQTDPTHLGVVTGYTSPPSSAACYQCHPQGTAGGMAAADHVRFFPIATASHPAICASCHTGAVNRQDPATLACASCHATRPGFAAVHASVADYPANAQSLACVSCHADGQVNRIADHQTAFPIAAASATHDTTCLACHTSQRSDKPWGADFTSFACVACHTPAETDPIHVGRVTDYVSPPTSAACYQCHPQGTGGMAPADHARFFPIATASHPATCANCHTDSANRQDPATLACASCHATRPGFAAVHTVTGGTILVVHTSRNASTPVPLTSPNCVRCHGDSQVDRVADHPRGDSAFGTGQHRTAGCLTCHTAARSDKPFAADFDGSPRGCVTCHPNGTGN